MWRFNRISFSANYFIILILTNILQNSIMTVIVIIQSYLFFPYINQFIQFRITDISVTHQMVKYF